MNDIPKIVFSASLREGPWPVTRIARGDLAAEIAAIRAEPGPDVIEARSFDCGVVVHIYRAQPARTARAAG